MREHIAQLIEEGAGIFLRIEIAAFPTPISPGAGQPVKYLYRSHFRPIALAWIGAFERRIIGFAAPQPGGDIRLDYRAQLFGYARFAEIFLGQDIACHLAPSGRHVNAFQLEDDRSVRITDFARRLAEFDIRVW